MMLKMVPPAEPADLKRLAVIVVVFFGRLGAADLTRLRKYLALGLIDVGVGSRGIFRLLFGCHFRIRTAVGTHVGIVAIVAVALPTRSF